LGNFEIACAELCGTGHYRMRALARVVTEQQFTAWLKQHEAQR
jgi:cytochrome c oxidase subunit 2